MKTYTVLKAMSDQLFSNPEKIKLALTASIKKARREKLILKQLNELNNGNRKNR